MNTEEYLLNLINRMLDDTLEYVPEEGISRYSIRETAHKEAAGLTNTDYIQPLKNLAERYSANTKKEKSMRRKIYFILECIAINTDMLEVYEYFSDRLEQETDQYILGDTLLLYLNRSSYVPPLFKIRPLVEDPRWQVRYEAIKMLGKYPKQEVEDVLLTRLHQSKDTYEMGYLFDSLRKIRSVKVLEKIEQFISHEKGEVRANAIAALSDLGGKAFLSTFMQALKDRSKDVKRTALYAMIEHGDERVIEALIERLRTIVKTKRKTGPAASSDSEVVKILAFLLRYQNKEEFSLLLDWLQQKKWDLLFENEKEWIMNNSE